MIDFKIYLYDIYVLTYILNQNKVKVAAILQINEQITDLPSFWPCDSAVYAIKRDTKVNKAIWEAVPIACGT